MMVFRSPKVPFKVWMDFPFESHCMAVGDNGAGYF